MKYLEIGGLMERIYKIYDIVLFSLIDIVVIAFGYLIFVEYSTDASEYSGNRLLWFISIVLLVVYIFYNTIILLRIKKYDVTVIASQNMKWIILRLLLIFFFFIVTWFLTETIFGSLIVMEAAVFQCVFPRPAFESMYTCSVGVIYKATLIRYDKIKEIELDDSSVVIKFVDSRKDKTFGFYDENKARAMYENLKGKQ